MGYKEQFQDALKSKLYNHSLPLKEQYTWIKSLAELAEDETLAESGRCGHSHQTVKNANSLGHGYAECRVCWKHISW